MTEEHSTTESTDGGVSPFQFTLGTMFLLVIAVAIVLSGYATGSGWAICLILALPMCTPIILGICSLEGQQRVQTFCFGAMLPACLGLLPILVFVVPIIAGLLLVEDVEMDRAEFERQLVTLAGVVSGLYLTTVLAAGLLALASRRMLKAAQSVWRFVVPSHAAIPPKEEPHTR